MVGNFMETAIHFKFKEHSLESTSYPFAPNRP